MSNEITAYFKGRIGVAESVYQYDYGMVLVIDNLDFTNDFDCYFSTSGDDEAIPAIGSDNRVAIPNECLNRAGDVTLHIPTHTGENDSEVENVVTFRVIGRARPVDDGTVEEQSAVSKAIALLNHTNSSVIETIDAYLDENAAESIQEWLDDHPEATTTVQDGAITKAKLADSLKDEINSKVSADLMNGHGYVSHATQQQILDCIYSYVDNYDKMVYGVGNTSPYLDNPAIDPDGRFRVSCSVLGMLVLYGVRFETSVMRYPAKTTATEMMSAAGTYLYKGSESGYTDGHWYNYDGNSLLDIGEATNDQYYSYGIHLDEDDAIEYTDGYRFYAHTLAPYLHSKGELFERADDFSNLQCGDVIFLSYMDEDSENWERIGHIMFFLCKNQRGDVKSHTRFTALR